MTEPKVFYPLLASLHAVVALASLYAGELTSPRELIRPILLALAFWAGTWVLAGRWSRDPHRRALFCLLMVWLLGYSGLLVHVVQAETGLTGWAADAVTLCGGGVGLLGVAYLVERRALRLDRVTRWLNLTFVMVLVISLLPAIQRRWAPRPTPLSIPAGLVVSADRLSAGDSLPDIYLVVLDGYTGGNSLRANFGFDNREFETFLRGKGFYVPERARANYVHTFLALAALLNWTHLDHLTTLLGDGNPDWTLAYPLVEHNRTWRFLERHGYRFVFFPTAMAVTARNRHAHLQLPPPRKVRTELETRLYQATVLPLLARISCRLLPCGNLGALPALESARLMDWKLERLADLPPGAGPQFVFAHLLMPHDPYVYDAECRHREPEWALSLRGAREAEVKASYVEEIRCVNRKMVRLVERLQARPGRPVVIILQSDHGHGQFGQALPSMTQADPARVRERADLFAAYHFPGSDSVPFYPTISPVNVFPLLFNRYLGARLPLLPDATFWSSDERPYDFAPVE